MCRDDAQNNFHAVTERLTVAACTQLDACEPVAIYPCMKRLTTEICLSSFLNLDFATSKCLAEDTVALTSHWHGIISVPLHFWIPGFTQKSSYGRAIDAKEKVLEIIDSKIQSTCDASNGFLAQITDASFRNHNDRDKLFLFGGGARDCLGRHVVTHILKRVCQELLHCFEW